MHWRGFCYDLFFASFFLPCFMDVIHKLNLHLLFYLVYKWWMIVLIFFLYHSGLLHISNITRARITSVSDLLVVDEKVKVLVVKSMFPGKISLRWLSTGFLGFWVQSMHVWCTKSSCFTSKNIMIYFFTSNLKLSFLNFLVL